MSEISFKDTVEIRRQEMYGILPNMQTKVTFNGKTATIRSATANERVNKDREGKVIADGK